jgi:hypothetical protein
MHGSIAKFFTVEGVCREPETVVGVGWLKTSAAARSSCPFRTLDVPTTRGLLGRRGLESS